MDTFGWLMGGIWWLSTTLNRTLEEIRRNQLSPAQRAAEDAAEAAAEAAEVSGDNRFYAIALAVLAPILIASVIVVSITHS